ncbi:UDP-N-acetyl glucosamine 2-epimerase [Cellvibrio zantedeschiae]|uniref:UDP-N-acetyl glucosamine 2-epimerase n=1 Tax=Cellvibrio zantedeschiae TaxID=1237077 RepID=A0ABQ3B0A8_9GAMM|nr:UDP-N-acetylglucosamine 2-epimerase [Cellvibrio zantedeschiae]GGY72298.1 UDP-N-acetyl glucosamine 2-epimerase [Cellvibrio zantedeschiae]
MLRKICVITSTRAEYGALKNLLREINDDSSLQLQLIVTGTHLSPEFGYTLKEIEADQFNVTKKVEILLSSDTAVGVSKSMGLAQISFAEVFDELQPDIVVVIGDRYELIPVVTCANIARIPVAHISGGEITEGAIDDMFRHATTKLSQLHFTAINAYSERVIQMGEDPAQVFTVGEPGLENIHTQDLLNKPEVETLLGTPLQEKNLLITYHPETCESTQFTEQSFKELLNALQDLADTLFIFTKANADTGGRTINHLIDQFVTQHPTKAIAFNSLGKRGYLSTLQFVDGVVGNSSSGIVEVASFKKGTINIGNRQKGRIRPPSVIDVKANQADIAQAIATLYSKEFQSLLQETDNPYRQEGTSAKIKEHLKQCDLNALKTKKFYDLGK